MKHVNVILSIIVMSVWAMSADAQNSVAAETLPSGEDSAMIKEPKLWHLEDPISYRHIISKPVYPDSCDVARLQHKSFWRAAAEVFGMNMSLWAFDRYVQKGHYAYISWQTIKDNFRHGFEWDNDHLSTNMFAHPYNGSIFYNAGRSNGYNFWQSELFAIGGSAMWEMCMEREYPSTNDIIATPVGGAALGEVFYRTSDVILDDRSTGWGRFGRELAAFVVDPMRGFTRIVTGRAWEHRPTTGRRFGVPPVSVDFALGVRYLSWRSDDEDSHLGGVADIFIEYGDRFAEKTHAPYDYFSFLMELQGLKSQPLLSRVEIIGRLLSREIVDRKRLDVSLGLYQHFDYFDSDTISPEKDDPLFPCSVPYKLGTPASVGGGVMFRYAPLRPMTFDGYLHFNGVILAGVLTDFYRDYHRNYNWGSGFSVKMGLNWSIAGDKLSMRFANQFYRIFTWKGYDHDYDWSVTPEGKPVDVQGDASSSSFNHLEFALNYRVWRRLYLSVGLDYYTRHTRYNSMRVTYGTQTILNPQINSDQVGCHLMLVYKL